MAHPTGTVTFLFTDVADSTRLWEEAPSAMRAALARHDELVRGAIEDRRGYVFATGGDSFSAAFQSLDDALDAAIAAQRMLGTEPWREITIRVRMALHIGQADERDGDYFGPALNRIARIMALAEGGEILTSESVAAIAVDSLPYGVSVTPAGERELKGLQRPEKVFRLEGPGLGSDEAAGEEPPQAGFTNADRRRRSIAVLAFDVMGGDDDTGALADGIAEDIITALSAWRHFPVTARNSSFAYRDQAKDIRQIAAELDVRFILEGSVRQSGSKVRVTAQLIDADDGTHVWAERYDGTLDDVFDFQDLITADVVKAIDPAVLAFEARRLAAERPSSFDAWDEFVRGRALVESLHPERVAEAVEHLERALELDPSMAGAHAWLGAARFTRAWANWIDDPASEFEAAIAHARDAVRLDQSDSAGHAVVGVVALFQGRIEEAFTSAERALVLNPSAWEAHGVKGAAILYSGDPAGSLPWISRCLELAPYGYWAPMMLATAGEARYLLGDYDIATVHARKALASRSGYVFARAILTASLARLDRIEEAAAELAEVRRLLPDFGIHSFNQPMLPDQLEEIMKGLRLAGLEA